MLTEAQKRAKANYNKKIKSNPKLARKNRVQQSLRNARSHINNYATKASLDELKNMIDIKMEEIKMKEQVIEQAINTFIIEEYSDITLQELKIDGTRIDMTVRTDMSEDVEDVEMLDILFGYGTDSQEEFENYLNSNGLTGEEVQDVLDYLKVNTVISTK